jgi:hypothetical protein
MAGQSADRPAAKHHRPSSQDSEHHRGRITGMAAQPILYLRYRSSEPGADAHFHRRRTSPETGAERRHPGLPVVGGSVSFAIAPTLAQTGTACRIAPTGCICLTVTAFPGCTSPESLAQNAGFSSCRYPGRARAGNVCGNQGPERPKPAEAVAGTRSRQLRSRAGKPPGSGPSSRAPPHSLRRPISRPYIPTDSS